MSRPLKRLAATAAILLTLLPACTDKPTDQPETISGLSIGFEVREEKTRAEATTYEKLEKIGVYGYSTGYERWEWISKNEPHNLTADYFCNTELQKISGWTYSPPRYWPINPNKRISFFAYAPFSDGLDGVIVPWPDNTADAGLPHIQYTVPANIEKQIDLLWGFVPDKTVESPLVNFTLNHALAALTFSVKYATEEESKKGYSLNVTAISVSGIYGRGMLDLGSGRWTFDPDDDPNKEFTISGDQIVSEDKPHLQTDTYETIDLLAVKDELLMLIPQDLSTAILTFHIEYIGSDKSITQTFMAFNLSDTHQAWLPGKQYHYQLLVKGDFITVETSVRSIWNESHSSGDVII